MLVRRSPPAGQSSNLLTTAANGQSAAQVQITPRNSSIGGVVAGAAKDTPYGTLRQLANLPIKLTTPLRRASSAGPSSHKVVHRTPAQRLVGATKRANPLTPHGKAAIRELEARRAGFTPGKDRRRSGRQQRETPRDGLRALSKLLAPRTEPVVPTPQDSNAKRFMLPDDPDDDRELERPKFSLALEVDEDDDDSLLLRPRSVGLEDENLTAHSVELPRRAHSEQPPGRLSRGSFGSVNFSDQFVEDNNELDRFGGIFESSFAVGGSFDGDAQDEYNDLGQDNTATLRGFGGRTSLEPGRDSDIQLSVTPGDDTENTFVFTFPTREFQVQPKLGSIADSPINDGYEPGHLDGVITDDRESWGNTRNAELNINMEDATIKKTKGPMAEVQKANRKRKVKISKHGIQFPSLPAGVVKKLAATYARTGGSSRFKISKEILDAIIKASDWFLEQLSDDLGAYAKHAGRKTINEYDIITLMKRQRQINATTTPFSLAQKHLPRELLQELRMAPPSNLKKGRYLESLVEEEVEN